MAINIGFTFHGLRALGLPTRTLQHLPAEFIEGMAARAHILGDIGDSAPANWDPIWQRPCPPDLEVAAHGPCLAGDASAS